MRSSLAERLPRRGAARALLLTTVLLVGVAVPSDDGISWHFEEGYRSVL